MTLTVKYRSEDNAAYIRLSQQKILDSAEVAPGVVFDYDPKGASLASNCSMPGPSLLRSFLWKQPEGYAGARRAAVGQ